MRTIEIKIEKSLSADLHKRASACGISFPTFVFHLYKLDGVPLLEEINGELYRNGVKLRRGERELYSALNGQVIIIQDDTKPIPYPISNE